MRTDEMSRRQRTDQRQFTRHTRRCDNARELLCVMSGVGRVCAFDAEHLEDGALGCEDGPTADGADFDAGHGDGHEQVFAVVSPKRSRISESIRHAMQG